MGQVVVALRTFRTLALPYFRSEDRLRGCLLAGGVIALEFGLAYVAVLVNQWNGRFFNALEARSWDDITNELVVFIAIFFVAVATGYGQYWFGQHFQMRWRRWMTERFVSSWMADGRHYRIRFVDSTLDNVHLRIANDVSIFIQKTHELGSSFVATWVYLVAFTVILWGISSTTPMPLFGTDLSFPGWLIVVAFAYACICTTIAHFLGRRLVWLNFNQQRREADLRFALTRVTDRSEQVALAHVEPVERGRIGGRIDALIANWKRLVAIQSNLIGFVYGYMQSSAVFPMLVVTPAYLTGNITLGVLMQAALAFQKVETSFSFLVGSYGKMAEWKASMDRIWQLELALRRVDEPPPNDATLRIAPEPKPGFSIHGLVLRLPTGEPIAAVPDLTLIPGERLLVSGPSGAGKSVLFRALSGIWPFADGLIEMPRDTRFLALASRSYFPLGTLRIALAMPAPAEAIDDAVVRTAMAAVGLGDLADRLDEEDEWASTLSGGQQQRIGFARVLIQRPDVLLLDDAVSALEDVEVRELYRVLAERLPSTIIVASGRNVGLETMHGFILELGMASKLRRLAATPLSHAEPPHAEIIKLATVPVVS